MSTPTAPSPLRREVYTELPLEDGTILAKGDEIHIRGEAGATFVFGYLVINPSGTQAVSCYGGTSDRGMFRSFGPDKLLVRKGRKAIRLAEYGDGEGVAAGQLDGEEATATEVPVAAKPAEELPDFDIEVRKQDRRPRGGAAGALAAQVKDGRVKPGTEISHGEHRAVITDDGWFTVAGERFPSPSSAASHCLGGRAANGWTWWRLPDGRKLADVR
jgi:hypothetical protein